MMMPKMIGFLAEDRLRDFKNEAAASQLAKQTQTASTVHQRIIDRKRLTLILQTLVNHILNTR